MYTKNVDILMKKIQQDYGYSQTNTGSDLKYALSFHVIDLTLFINIFCFSLFVSFLVEITATQQKNFWRSFFYRSSRRKQLS